MEKNVHRRSLIATTRPETLLSQRVLELFLNYSYIYTVFEINHECLILQRIFANETFFGDFHTRINMDFGAFGYSVYR